MNIDANKVIEHYKRELSEANYKIALLTAQVETLVESQSEEKAPDAALGQKAILDGEPVED